MNKIPLLIKALQTKIQQCITFELTDVSFYPTVEVQARIMQAIYGSGEWTNSQKWRDEFIGKKEHLHGPRPLAHCPVKGSLILFLNEHGKSTGMMDLQMVFGKRPDINRSIVPSVALAPNLLHVTEWGNGGESYYAVDKEGSRWSLHCKLDC